MQKVTKLQSYKLNFQLEIAFIYYIYIIYIIIYII